MGLGLGLGVRVRDIHHVKRQSQDRDIHHDTHIPKTTRSRQRQRLRQRCWQKDRERRGRCFLYQSVLAHNGRTARSHNVTQVMLTFTRNIGCYPAFVTTESFRSKHKDEKGAMRSEKAILPVKTRRGKGQVQGTRKSIEIRIV